MASRRRLGSSLLEVAAEKLVPVLYVPHASETYVIRSLRSLAFFRPPKAILVPGMYFLGFSR